MQVQIVNNLDYEITGQNKEEKLILRAAIAEVLTTYMCTLIITQQIILVKNKLVHLLVIVGRK